ncbi:hypothetical protein Goarm_002233, partial [Gossypium armourianum]|nr:hypothetical protein [Gossypium armourianum]
VAVRVTYLSTFPLSPSENQTLPLRKVARVRLITGFGITAYIPGTLDAVRVKDRQQEHSSVMGYV